MSLSSEERRSATHVMPYLLDAYDEAKRIADSAFGKAEQYLQASRVCDEMRLAAEAERDRLTRENERLTETLRKIGRGDYAKSDAEFYARKALAAEEPA